MVKALGIPLTRKLRDGANRLSDGLRVNVDVVEALVLATSYQALVDIPRSHGLNDAGSVLRWVRSAVWATHRRGVLGDLASRSG